MLWLAFERIGLHRVALSVFGFNERAVRSYEKAGFAIEGREREAIIRDGKRWDEITMGILQRDWRARQAGSQTSEHDGDGTSDGSRNVVSDGSSE